MTGTGSESTTKDLTKTITAPSYLKKAIASDTITCTVSTAVTTTRSKDDNDYCKTTVRIKISTTTSTKADMTQYGYGENSNGTISGSYKIPTNATVIYICVEAWTFADGQWGHNATTTLNVDTINVVFTSSDTTAPTLSTDEGINWTSKDHFNIADSSTGVREWSYNYTSPSGTSSSKSGSYDEESSKSTSKSVQFQNDFGKYVITAKDNAGNSHSYTIYYYNPTLSVVPSVTAGGSATIGKGTSTGSATSINGLSPSDNYKHTLSATTKSGYFFTGWTGSGIISNQGVGEYVSESGHTTTWKISPTLNAGKDITTVPSSSSATYTAQFKSIQDYFPKGYSLNDTFDNSAHGIDRETLEKNIQALNSLYTVTVNYVSKDNCVVSDYNSPDKPTYAGTYTIQVTVWYNTKKIGYGEYTLTIGYLELPMLPEFTKYEKVYDGTTSTTILEFKGWKYQEPTHQALGNGVLALEFNSGEGLSFLFDNKNVGDSREIVYNTEGNASKVTISSKNDATGKIAGSCIFKLSSQKITAKITARSLTLSASASDYNGTVTGRTKNGSYVENVYGKVYDGTDSATITKITVGNIASGESITVNEKYVSKFESTAYGASDKQGDRSLIISNITLIAGSGTLLSNYTYENSPASGTFTKSVEGLTIVRKEVTVDVTLKYASRVYDGTTNADISSARIDGLCSSDYKDGKGVVLQSGYTASFKDKKCGTNKTVTVSGLALTYTDGYSGVQTNYYLASSTLTLSADITQKEVSVSITCAGKTYDGNDTATVAYTISGICTVDTYTDKVSASGTAVYDSKNYGYNRTVTATGITLSGEDSSNYYIPEGENIATCYATIAQKSLSAEGIAIATIGTFTYDGKEHKPTPNVTETSISNPVWNVDYTYSYDGDKTSRNGDTTNAGTKVLTVVATGTGNYSGSISTTYEIVKAECQIVGLQNITVIYGQQVSADSIIGTVYNKYLYNIEGEENLGVKGSWTFVESVPNSGIPKVADSRKYKVHFTPSEDQNYITPADVELTLTVNKRPITITANPQTSVYGNEIQFASTNYVIEAKNSDANTGLVSKYDTFGDLRVEVTSKTSVGDYTIYGNLLKNANYTITYVSANYTITKRPINVRPDSLSKTYGDSDPVLKYTVTNGLDDETLVGVLERAEGENVGTYYVYAGTLVDDNNPNYSITFVENVTFRIEPRNIEITPKDASSYFGEEIIIDNTAFSVTNVASRDIADVKEEDLQAKYAELFPISVIRTDVGTNYQTNSVDAKEYSLLVSSEGSTLNSNYNATFKTGKYTIYARPITITPTAGQYKTYGDEEPVLAYTVSISDGYKDILAGSPIVAGYPLDGTLVREEGEDVKASGYLISAGGLSNSNPKNANYKITFSVVSVYFMINQKKVTVRPIAITINYGDENPANDTLEFTTDPADVQIKGGLRLPDASYSGEVTPREAGSYQMLADDQMLTQNPNYNITVWQGTTFTIKPLTAVIVPIIQTMTFGYKFTDEEGNLGITIGFTAYDELKETEVTLDHFTGSLSLDCTLPEDGILNVGTYKASYGSLKSNDYIVKLLDDNKTAVIVTTKPITVSVNGVDENNSVYYVYGTTYTNISGYMPGFTVSESTPLVEGHGLNASSTLSRESIGSHSVGQYKMTTGDLASKNKNYSFSLDRDYYYVITARPIIIVPSEATSIYGNADAVIKYTTVSAKNPDEAGLLSSQDKLSGALSREPGKNVGKYKITLGSLNDPASLLSNPNYSVTLSDEAVYYTITRRTIQISARAVKQVFGENEQNLSINYKYTNQLVSGDVLVGSLRREAGATVGTYQINQGTVTNENNPNYDIVFDTIGSTYTITQRPVTIRVNSATKEYGTADPEFTYRTILGQNTSGTPFIADYDPSPYITISRVNGEIVKDYNFIVTIDKTQDVTKNYNFTTDTRTNKFTITRATTAIGFADETYLDSDGNYRLDINYDGTIHNVKAIVTEGDPSAQLSYRINGKISQGFTNVGEYIVSISVAQTANYNGISHTVYVTVAPCDLGEFDVVSQIDAKYLTKVYGESDNRRAYTKTIDGIGDDKVTVTLQRESGENAGTYDFTDIALNNTNYAISLGASATGAYRINKKEITVTPHAFSKTYGESDPVLRQTVDGIDDEKFVVEFTREAGENAGKYDFTEVSSLDSNYAPIFALDSNLDAFTIRKKDAFVFVANITVTFNGTEHSVELSYSTDGYMPYDAPEFTLTVDGFELGKVPVNAGSYQINASEPSDEIKLNYNVTVNPGVYLIEKAPITVTVNADSVEYGYPIPEFTYAITEGSVFAGFPLTGELGNIDSTNVGVHDIPQGTLNDDNNPNYALTFESATLTVTTRHITVTPVATTNQVYGDAHADIQYNITSGSLVEGETLSGALAAESYFAGTHAVVIGSLQELNPNYAITLDAQSAEYNVSKRPVVVKANAVSSAYGDPVEPLTYVVNGVDGAFGLVQGDNLDGELSANIGVNFGSYPITRGTLSSDNYDITFEGALYSVEKRNVTVTIGNQASDFGAPIVIDQRAYAVTDGSVMDGDNLGIVLSKQLGEAMGNYPISATFDNQNYNVTFVNGVYTVRKYSAQIIIDTDELSKVFDGNPISIIAGVTGTSNVRFLIDGQEVGNNFTEVGKYYVEITADETDEFYAPESVYVTVTVKRGELVTEESGIDIKIENQDGYDPDIQIDMKKLPQDDSDMNSVLSSNQTIVGAFSVGTIEQENFSALSETDVLRIKVPSALSDADTIKVVISDENGTCSLNVFEVEDGYITITAKNVKAFAFVQEAPMNLTFLYYVFAGVALIVIISLIVFVFRKRA